MAGRAHRPRGGGRGDRRPGAGADRLEGLRRPAAPAVRGLEAACSASTASTGTTRTSSGSGSATPGPPSTASAGSTSASSTSSGSRCARPRSGSSRGPRSSPTSTDWAVTATAFRDLMQEWKAAGRTARKEDDALWARFRAAQDAFFAARTAANDQVESEFRENLKVKEQLLAEAEALLPVRDPQAARTALRDIQDRWEAAGKVPRADLGPHRGAAARRRAGGAGRRAGALGAEQPPGACPRAGRRGPAGVDDRRPAQATGLGAAPAAASVRGSRRGAGAAGLARSGSSRPAARHFGLTFGGP